MFGRAQKRKEKHIAPELLSAYLDKQVTPQERGRVEQHLRACAVCARELDTLRYTTDLLRATPRVSVPHAFTLSETDVGRTAARRRANRFSAYLQGATAVVAALLLIVAAGDVLRVPMLYEAPAPMVAEKAVVETVLVEAEAEAVQDTGIVAVQETQETDRAGKQVVEKHAEAEMQALAATPRDEPLAVGGGQPQASGPEPAPTVVALRAEEPPRETAPPPEQPKLSAPPAPAAEEAVQEKGEEETAVSLAVAPTPTPLPQPTPAHLGEAVRPDSWWTLPHLVEIALAGLLVILLSLSLWLRRRR